MQVERILREYGQFLRPMTEAPRDGRRILAHVAPAHATHDTADGGHFICCYWEPRPAGLIGPNWLEEQNSAIGYVDRYFDGWIDPRDFTLLDRNAVNRLLIAFIDDARAADDREALKVLEV